MKIIQALPSFAFGDAIGNDVIALSEIITELGYKSAVYAKMIDSRLPTGLAKSSERLKLVDKDDIIIYHLSTGDKLNYDIADIDCRKIIYYHNITPPHFFEGYNVEAVKSCTQGLESAKAISTKFDYALAVSEFNKKDMLNMGYKQDIEVLPILIPFSDYLKKPSPNILKRYTDGMTNILFTGRIAPNKKHEDIIQAFYYYKKNINPKSRLILVGSGVGERYYNKLAKYINELELKDVIFPGHISFNDILAFYKVADVFLCMSEHEGFCVPLVEAMFFNVPIIAYNSTAIPDTLGEGGVLLETKDYALIAEVINEVVENKSLRGHIIGKQKEKIKEYSYDIVSGAFKKYIKKILGE